MPPQSRRTSLILLPLVAAVFVSVFAAAARVLQVDGIDRILSGFTRLWGRKHDNIS
jgi:hypothetical protein